MADTLFIQLARSPVVGAVKTRMVPFLSPQRACDLHCSLVEHTTRQLLAAKLGAVWLGVAGDMAHPLFDSCRGQGVDRVFSQLGTDLGERMYQAISDGLETFPRVVLVGSDCPGMDRDYLAAACLALEQVPLVIGPAEDGGYVLIGTRAGGLFRALFAGIDWGSSRVLEQTIERINQQGLGWQRLSSQTDMDRPEDLKTWAQKSPEHAWQFLLPQTF